VGIDHDAEEPLYLQLAAILRGQIEAGEITSRVPSVKTLTEQYGIAQGTAERALTSWCVASPHLVRKKSARHPPSPTTSHRHQPTNRLVRWPIGGIGAGQRSARVSFVSNPSHANSSVCELSAARVAAAGFTLPSRPIPKSVADPGA